MRSSGPSAVFPPAERRRCRCSRDRTFLRASSAASVTMRCSGPRHALAQRRHTDRHAPDRVRRVVPGLAVLEPVGPRRKPALLRSLHVAFAIQLRPARFRWNARRHAGDQGNLLADKQMAAIGNIVYFVTENSPSHHLWRSDGTAAGTQPVTPLGRRLFAMVAAGSHLHLLRDDLPLYSGLRRLRRYGGWHRSGQPTAGPHAHVGPARCTHVGRSPDRMHPSVDRSRTLPRECRRQRLRPRPRHVSGSTVIRRELARRTRRSRLSHRRRRPPRL